MVKHRQSVIAFTRGLALRAGASPGLPRSGATGNPVEVCPCPSWLCAPVSGLADPQPGKEGEGGGVSPAPSLPPAWFCFSGVAPWRVPILPGQRSWEKQRDPFQAFSSWDRSIIVIRLSSLASLALGTTVTITAGGAAGAAGGSAVIATLRAIAASAVAIDGAPFCFSCASPSGWARVHARLA